MLYKGRSGLDHYMLLAIVLSTPFLCIVQAYSQSKFAYNPGKKEKIHSNSVAGNFRLPEDPQKRSLLDVLIALNKARGVYFLYSQQALGRIPVNNCVIDSHSTIEMLLGQVLLNTGLVFKKIGEKTYVILPGKVAKNIEGTDRLYDAKLESVKNNIRGIVATQEGRLLPGVSITVKGTKEGTSSDARGEYSIAANKADTLVFSSVGYITEEMPAGEVAGSDVFLKAADQSLTEVFVTAMGINKQEKSLGYSATALEGSRFTQSREVNIGKALSGQVAGVSVTGDATGPYGSSRVLIRGNASLSGNNQPLYVIDGVPYDNTNQGYPGQWGGADLGDGLSNINPDDIESIEILKGVAASALFGYRGGNGAILITTKSGSGSHGLGVEVNNNATVESAIDRRAYQYTYGQGLSGVKPTTAAAAADAPNFSWGAKLDGSRAVNFLGNAYAYSPARSNFKNFFRTGFTDQNSIGLSGGNDRGHFRLGLSDLHLNDIVPNSSMKQQGLNLNSTYNITRRLQMVLTADYIFEQVDNRASLSDKPGNVMAAPLYLANSFDIRWLKNNTVNPDGTELLPGTGDLYFENPYYIAYDYQNTTTRNRLTGGLTLKYRLLDWLVVQGQLARDGYIFDFTNITPSGVGYTRSDGIHGGNLTQFQVNYHEMNSNFMIGINKKLGEKFVFTANAGGNQQDNVNQISGIGQVPNSGNRPAGPFLIAGDYNLDNINPIARPVSTQYQHYRVNSLYGSADIAYKNYLFLTVTARNDWFSTLNINTDSYLYPSVSAGFVFSDAWRLPAWISFGKIRASYAESSNGTAPYQNTKTYGVQGYTISGQPVGYVATNGLIPNASLRPASITEEELGLNMQFLNNRLGFDLTVYDKLTTNDIVRLTVSSTSGYSQQVENIGQLRNRGIELLLTASPVKTRDFNWLLSANLAYSDNKVLSLGGEKSIIIDGAYPRWGSEMSVSNVAGLAYGQIMGYAYKRDSRGNIIYSDGVSNPAPAGEPEHTGVVPLGSGVYKETGGLTNEFHYKNFSLSFLLDFKFGAKIYSGTNLLLYYYGLQKTTLQGRDQGYIGKGVMENGHSNTIAVPAQQYFQDISAGGSDHIAEEFVYDASFIKWRSVSLGYGFPASVFKKGFVKGINISLVGRNLAILMKHTPNIDPESGLNNTNGQGLELSGYPAVRSMGLNINVKF